MSSERLRNIVVQAGADSILDAGCSCRANSSSLLGFARDGLLGRSPAIPQANARGGSSARPRPKRVLSDRGGIEADHAPHASIARLWSNGRSSPAEQRAGRRPGRCRASQRRRFTVEIVARAAPRIARAGVVSTCTSGPSGEPNGVLQGLLRIRIRMGSGGSTTDPAERRLRRAAGRSTLDQANARRGGLPEAAGPARRRAFRTVAGRGRRRALVAPRGPGVVSIARCSGEIDMSNPAEAKRGLIARWRERRRARAQRAMDRTLARREHEIREREKPPRHTMSQPGG